MVQIGLQGKVALVTGANHGIGAATAQALAAEGVAVFINYLHMPPLGMLEENLGGGKTAPGLALYNARRALSADGVLEAIHAQGGKAEALEADLSDPATIPLLFDRAEAAFGPVEILINNADYCVGDTFIPHDLLGIAPQLPGGYAATTFTASGHDQHFAVNSRAVALMITEFARRHVQRGKRWGRIINISSDGAPAFAHEISYGASKYALESYSRAAAKELGQFGITVNIVSPGPIQTGHITPEIEQQVNDNTPLGRVGQPDDVADVITFLASEQARWLTGQLLFVGGGHRMI
ncbi:3-ketoacyl-ACP reductase [Reticulibacter mediterranei]|uniref:3-ketoacyl-ACP reductase n=1 Tax=Reticulibacter mediterranei TaxID=2778369 RepID=A0A8J3N7B9_9CHLR|nr:SDR family oxidoreductase [Reticulibacter mediterranei]GHO96992.1 3-ketoacyl-ACP reductase [Reticulibacter mediterranei]